MSILPLSIFYFPQFILFLDIFYVFAWIFSYLLLFYYFASNSALWPVFRPFDQVLGLKTVRWSRNCLKTQQKVFGFFLRSTKNKIIILIPA